MTLADNVVAMQTQIATLQTAVNGITAGNGATNDQVVAAVAPVLEAVAAVQTKVNDIDTQVNVTPAA